MFREGHLVQKEPANGYLDKNRQIITFGTPFWNKQIDFLSIFGVPLGPPRDGSLPEFIIFVMNLQVRLKTNPEGAPGGSASSKGGPGRHLGIPRAPFWIDLGSTLHIIKYPISV